jgi:hypothetical protein
MSDADSRAILDTKFLIAAPVIALSILLFSVSATQARTVDLGRQGYWSFSAYYDDSGEFSFCEMSTGSKVGTENFSLAVGPSGFMVTLYDDNWDLNEGDKYDSKTWIGEKYWEGFAGVIDRKAVLMKFAPDSGFGAAFARGSRMNFEIGELSRSLDLRGSSSALTQLGRCFVNRMPNSNPFGKAKGDGNPFE